MKKSIKLKLLALLLAVCGLANAESVLVFEPLSGDESEIASQMLSKVVFSGDNIVVIAADGGVLAEYYKYDYRRIVFSNNSVDAVAEAQGGQPQIKVYPNPTNDVIMISGLQNNSKVALYNLHGGVLMQKQADGEASLSVGSLPNGVYILSINGETIKVIKQ